MNFSIPNPKVCCTCKYWNYKGNNEETGFCGVVIEDTCYSDNCESWVEMDNETEKKSSIGHSE